jgi:hypothetical protein
MTKSATAPWSAQKENSLTPVDLLYSLRDVLYRDYCKNLIKNDIFN